MGSLRHKEESNRPPTASAGVAYQVAIDAWLTIQVGQDNVLAFADRQRIIYRWEQTESHQLRQSLCRAVLYFDVPYSV
jgi:hypothetical protein